MKKIIVLFVFLVNLSFLSCIPGERKMMKTELKLAEKYQAESFKLNFKTIKKNNRNKLEKDRKIVSVVIKNSENIEQIFTDDRYTQELSNSIANYIIDSLAFKRLPFQPDELQIEYISEQGFSLLKNERKRMVSYKVEK